MPIRERIAPEEAVRLRQLIETHHLGAAAEVIISNAAPCIVLERGPQDEYERVGNCRSGGDPDLPADVAWPSSAAGNFAFVMQLNLADCPMILDGPLPEQGMLYFFVGDDQDDLYHVFYADVTSASLSRRPSPPMETWAEIAAEQYADLKPHSLILNLGISLPHYGSTVFDHVREVGGTVDGKDGGDRYFDLIDEAHGGSCERGMVDVVGKLLGHASELQGDMLEVAHLRSSGAGHKIFDIGYRKEHRETIVEGAREWRLLWQIYSDFEVGFCIMDAGSFSILVKHTDLAQREFESVVVEIET